MYILEQLVEKDNINHLTFMMFTKTALIPQPAITGNGKSMPIGGALDNHHNECLFCQ